MAATQLLVLTAILAAGVSAGSLGSVAKIEEHPSLAQVEFHVALFWVQQCAASLVTNRHVATLATCFSGPLYFRDYRRVRVGASQRSTGGNLLGIEDETLHPDFGLLGYDSDIAIIRLDDYVTFSPSIQQVPIIGQSIELPFGLPVTLAGWGTTTQGGETSNVDLYSLDLVVTDQEQCLLNYIWTYPITENMVCAGVSYTKGRAFDSRDSGAPILYEDFLVGILAFGEHLDDDDEVEKPLVFTSISHFTDWIIKTAV